MKGQQITARRLLNAGCCRAGVDRYFQGKSRRNIDEVIKEAIEAEDFADVCVAISCVLSRKQNVEWAIYSASLALPVFEARYPDDKRPRKAIAAARRWLKNPSGENKVRAAYAADAAADAADAADAAAYAAADAAAYAAYAAAYAAADAAADAAYAAAYAAANAAANADAAKATYIKIIRKGVSIWRKSL